jgi:60 kDa SS-A/Ro ribonucleoprotein
LLPNKRKYSKLIYKNAVSPKNELIQYVMTGCFNNTFYTEAQQDVKRILDLLPKVDLDFIAKLAIYARKNGYMKDTPAFLLAYLCAKNYPKLEIVFAEVIDNVKMLRNFVQMILSNLLGRRSFGSKPKKLIAQYINQLSDTQLLNGTVGNKPFLADVIKLTHVKADNEEKNEGYKYILGKEYVKERLPEAFYLYELFKENNENPVPNVDFRLLDALPLTENHWTQIAMRAPWHMTSMNLNTFYRHGVFKSAEATKVIADRLKSEEEIKKSKVFPYQLFAAYTAANSEIPFNVRDALYDATEIATQNVPDYVCKVAVFCDVSGSMNDSVTGYNGSATSKMRYIDIAGLITSVILRKNKDAIVLPFCDRLHNLGLTARDSILTNTKKLSFIRGGGTHCALPLAYFNQQNTSADLIIYVSDNQSWIGDSVNLPKTETKRHWEIFKRNNPKAKMICIDIAPYNYVLINNDKDVLNVGGFSDSVFTVIDNFLNSEKNKNQFEHVINSIPI